MEEMRLPVKLWRDTLETATTPPDEFNIACPTPQCSEQYSADQCAQGWRAVVYLRMLVHPLHRPRSFSLERASRHSFLTYSCSVLF